MPHRLFVLTDISSLESGVREPDDGQSLIRLLLYASAVRIEGLCATSNLGHGQVCRPELIHTALSAYDLDFPKLREHDTRYPSPDALRKTVKTGQPRALPDLPVEESIGPGKDTEASEHLIECAMRFNEYPLWVCAWGGTADLAQALWKLSTEYSWNDLAHFASSVRVHASYDQDSTAQWVKKEFPTLFYITRQHPIRGMYRGGVESLVSSAWVQENVKSCGALGALYPDYNGSDPWGRVEGVKEGDTPTWLNLVGPDPLDGWGGIFTEVVPHRYEDAPSQIAPDHAAPEEVAPDPRCVNVSRHREAFQADFARRLNWLR